MSRTTTAARRIALLSTSSFGLTAIASAASLGAALTPTTALAADECGVQAGTTPIVCSATTYFPGVTYGANGNLVVTFTNSGATEAGVDGITLTGDGSESITFDSATTETELESRDTVGPLLDVTTVSGDINIQTEEMDADGQNPAGVTHAIRATSGSGNVNITTTGLTDADSTSNPAGAIAIEAVSGAGNITVTGTSTSNSAIAGRLSGILARTSGTGTLTITHSGGIRASDGAGIAMDLAAGTGKMTVNSTGSSATIGAAGVTSSFTGTALRAVYGGDATFNLQTVTASGSNWLVDLSTATGTNTVINLGGTLGTDTSTMGWGSRILRVQGGADVSVNVAGRLQGLVDLSGAGDVAINIAGGGQWRTRDTSVFGAGDDTVTLASGSRLITAFSSATNSQNGDVLETPIILQFGGGTDRFVNNGSLLIGAGWSDGISDIAEIEMQLVGLEQFDNAGLIMLGVRNANQSDANLITDNTADDVLLMPGTAFTGSGDSLIWLDVDLNGQQLACDVALRDPVTFNMPAADCVGIQGGSTAGVTRVRVNELVSGDRGSTGRIVLVDVSGGTSDVGHFVLDPDSSNYSAANGGVIDKGFFIFPLVYDADTQQHLLAGTPGGDAQQLTLAAEAGQGLWRLSTGTWLDRQADLRNGFEDGGGVWMRVATEFTDRDAIQTVDIVGNPFSFNNSHRQDSYAVTGGLDVLTGGSYVLGVTAGYAHSDLSFDPSPNTYRMNGWTGGLYSSFVSGGLFVDAVVSASRMMLEGDVPALNLKPASTLIDTNYITLGGQVEAGWRFALTDTAFVEPLAGVSYVRAKYDELSITPDDPLRPPIVVEFDDPTSLRGSLGARAGIEQSYGVVRAQYSVLARAWEEFDGETHAVAHNTGQDAPMSDTFDGAFTEAVLGASFWSPGGAVNGFINVGGKFGDDYEAKTATVGIRAAW